VKQFVYTAAFFISILAVMQSCTKIDTTNLGGGLIPVVDNINTFDTIINVETDLLPLADSTIIFSSESQAVGLLQDAEFGTTDARMNFNVYPASFGIYPFIKAADSLSIDSVVLVLANTNIYGDTNATQTIVVSELQAGVLKDSTGYKISNPFFNTAGQLATKTVLLNSLNNVDSITENGSKVNTANTLRLQLPASFGDKFIRNYTTAVQYKNDTTYKAAFGGFEIKSNTGGKALSYYSITNAATKLQFYYKYKKTNSANFDTTGITSFTFRAFSDTVNTPRVQMANTIRRTPSGNYQAALTNAATNEQELFIQSSPGAYVKITIPGLSNLTNRVIHQAQLIAEKLPSADEEFLREPSLLFLDATDIAANKIFTVPNSFVADGQGSYNVNDFGGIIRNNFYRFDLTRYVQGIVTKKETSYTLRLYAPYNTKPLISNTSTLSGTYYISSPVAAGRVKLGGGAHPVKKMQLKIIYSKI
jgi:Domain of unknown function (DUF4270)